MIIRLPYFCFKHFVKIYTWIGNIDYNNMYGDYLSINLAIVKT